MKSFYLLICLLTTLNLWSQTTVAGSIEFPDWDCSNSENTLFFKVSTSEKILIDSGYIVAKCTFSTSLELEKGMYEFELLAEGYAPIFRKFNFDDAPVNLGIFQFKESSKLDEVVVQSNKENFIIQEADKSIYNIEQNEILNSGSLYEAVTQLPGVIATADGMIVYNGKSISVWIDGQPSQLSGQSLIAFLNSFPANVIEKIEIIPNPGAAYDANTSGGIINIITKNKSIKGISGSFTDNFQYSKEHKLNNSMSANVNGRVKKWNYRLTLGNSYYNSLQNTSNSRQLESDNTIYQYQSKNITDYDTPGNFINSNLSYSLTENTTLSARFNYNQNENHNTFTQENKFTDFNNIVRGNYDNRSNWKSGRLKFNSKLDTLGKRVNVFAQYYYNKSEGLRPQTSILDLSPTYSISDQRNHNETFTLQGDLNLPFAKPQLTLELGGKFYTQRFQDLGQYNLNSLDESILENPYYVTINNFLYRNNNLGLYTQLKKNFGKLSATAGIRYEDFKLMGKNDNQEFYNENFSNVYPSFHFKYDLSPVALFLNYTRKVDMPSYSQINPNLEGYYDQFYSETGNPNLKPRFFNNAEFKISFMEYLTFGLEYSRTENQVFNVFEVDGPVVTRIPVALDRTEFLTFNFQLPIPFAFFTEGLKLLDRPNLGPESLSYIVFFGSYNQVFFTSEQEFFGERKPHNWWTGSYTNIILGKDFTFNMMQFWIPKGSYSQYKIEKSIWRFNLSLNKYFFEKDLKLSVGVRDLFNSYENNIYYSQPQLQTNFYQKWDSQKFTLSLTWKIGKYKSDENSEFGPSNVNSSENGIGL